MLCACLSRMLLLSFFFFNAPAPTEIYTLSLHDALPISMVRLLEQLLEREGYTNLKATVDPREVLAWVHRDRKSTRLNSSHITISYAVFCLKKKNKTI